MIPEYLRNTILKDYSNEEYESIVNGYNSHRPVTLRINNLKTTKDNIINLLKIFHFFLIFFHFVNEFLHSMNLLKKFSFYVLNYPC